MTEGSVNQKRILKKHAEEPRKTELLNLNGVRGQIIGMMDGKIVREFSRPAVSPQQVNQNGETLES